jgi:hypothetical protein
MVGMVGMGMEESMVQNGGNMEESMVQNDGNAPCTV